MLFIVLSLGILVVLFLTGLPVAFAFGLTTIILADIFGYSLDFLLPFAFDRMRSLLLLSIPLFIIAGAVMEKGDITGPLIDFIDSIVSHLKGGLGTVGVVAQAVFGAISGSAAAAIACVGSIMIPRLVDEGYPRGYATSLMAASAGLSLLIPPSISMILYGWITNTSITACFLAGAGPGILLAIFFIIINWFAVGRYTTVKKPRPWGSPKQVAREVAGKGWHALPALMMPVVILGVIYGGIATPTEAAAIAVLYAIPVGFFVYRGLTARKLASALIECSTNVGAIMVMLFFAMAFSRMLITENVPKLIAGWMLSVTDNKIVILLIVNAFLFLVGMFMDDVSGMIITAPLLLPVVREIGLSSVQFSAIITSNLTMGLMTPPMAPLIFLGQIIGKTTFTDMFKPSMVLVFLGYLPVVLITSYWAPLSEWLPVALLGSKVLIPAY